MEIYASLINNFSNYIWPRYLNPGLCGAFIQSLYRADIFYADKHFVYFSTNNNGEGKKDYENFSDRFQRLFPGYHLDSTMHIRADPGTIVLNLKELIKLFLSKDEALWQ